MTEDNKPQAKITGRERLYDGFFKIDELTIEMDKHAGGQQTVKRLSFERGHAVAILGYDPARDEVVLVNEMRPGMLAAGEYPFNDSLPAGMIDKGETAIQAAMREMEEETGVELEHPVEVHAGAYVSAGGTSERLALVAGVIDASKAGGVHGEAGEGEDIKTVILKSDEFIARAENGEIKDMKSLVLAFWLAQHRDELKQKVATTAPGKDTTSLKIADVAKTEDGKPAGATAKKPQAQITERKPLYEGVFKVEELTIEMDKHEGGTQTLKRLLFERGDAIAILGYDPVRDEVVLINEMRTGMLSAGDYPFSDSVPAAMIGKGEDVLKAAENRLERETGVKLQDANVIHKGAFVSSGGTSERIVLVAGTVDSSTAAGIHGRPEKGEDIKTVVMKSDDFIARAEDGSLKDMKSLAFAFWLAKHRTRLQKDAAAKEQPGAKSIDRKISGIF